jgi:type VI protein secretion system component VasK
MSKRARKQLLEKLPPIIVIFICTAIALVALIGLGFVSPFFYSRQWTWLLYLVGSIIIFLIYRARARQRRPSDPSVGGKRDPASGQNAQEIEQDLGEIRRRVRVHKARKSEEPKG